MSESKMSTDSVDRHRSDRRNSADADPETYAIIGAAMEVHRELGYGFLEAVYQEALALEFQRRNIPYQREIPVQIKYKDQVLLTSYRADFVCFQSVLLELKALSKMGGTEESQVLNYLKATGLGRGLLINFGKPSLEYKRFIFNPHLRQSEKSVDIPSSLLSIDVTGGEE